MQALEHVPENFDDENHHAALAFLYYSDAYGVFLSGADDFSEQDQYLEQRYGVSKNMAYLDPILKCSSQEE